jgi:hypothetical protein
MSDWLVVHKDIIDATGILGGLFFGGLGTFFAGIVLLIDARVRRAETLIEITKQHRELWMYFDEHAGLAQLFDKKRDMRPHPLADEEVRFANFLFLHLRASYGAKRARIHVLPEHAEDDWRDIFTYPAIVAAWENVKHLHDRKFVALVENYQNQARLTAQECPTSRR